MPAAGWCLDEVEGVQVARCLALDDVSGTAHAFSTRVAHGNADFDLGASDGVDEAVRRRRESFLRAAGLGGAPPLILRQVHGDRLVNASGPADRVIEADGSFRLLGLDCGTAVPAVRTADCVALLFVDRHAQAVAAVHAGWRGTAAGIAAKAVLALASQGVDARNLVVAMGPAILGCCYEVGEAVAAAVEAACPPGLFSPGKGSRDRLTIDLHAANRAQLIDAGVPVGGIHAAPWCTSCRNDLFFSVRAEGASAGRLMAAVGPSAAP